MRFAWAAMLLCTLMIAGGNATAAAARRGAAARDARVTWWDREEIARDRRELADYYELLARMDTAIAQARVVEIVRVNDRLHYAMHRELGQARGRAGDELAPADRQEADTGGGIWEWALSGRIDRRFERRDRERVAARAARMRELIDQARPLEAAVRTGDTDAIRRNRRILGKFGEIMREEFAAVETGAHHSQETQEQATR